MKAIVVAPVHNISFIVYKITLGVGMTQVCIIHTCMYEQAIQ